MFLHFHDDLINVLLHLNAKFRTGLNYEKPLWVWVMGLLLELAISFKAYALFYFKIIYI